MVRKTTNRILEMADDGAISWKDLAECALRWMSEDDVAEMCKANELLPDDEEDEEEEVDPTPIRITKVRICPHCAYTSLTDANTVVFCPICGTPLL